jgi:hypothetical protein
MRFGSWFHEVVSGCPFVGLGSFGDFGVWAFWGWPAEAAAGFVGGGRWFHGTFLSLMDDGRADLSRSNFSVRAGAGRGTVAGWDVIERKVEKILDLWGWRLVSCETVFDLLE